MSPADPLPRLPFAAAELEGAPRYRLYGFNLLSDFPFATPLPPADAAPDLYFFVVDEPPLEIDWARHPPLHRQQLGEGESQAHVALHRLDEGPLVLRFESIADFYLWPDRIFCRPAAPDVDYLIEIAFLGIVLSVWLELRGVLALHASACVLEAGTLAFLSHKEGGKSTLTAALLEAGCPLLTDDLLPLAPAGDVFLAQPSFPSLRLWPEQIKRFRGPRGRFALVHPNYEKRRVPVGQGFGSFAGRPVHLSRIYLLERRDPEVWGEKVMFQAIAPAEAVIELLRFSFVGSLIEALGLESRRLALLGSMLQQVPLLKMIYPNGFDHLPALRDAILEG